MSRAEAGETKWNRAVSELHAALAGDTAIQAIAADTVRSSARQLVVVLAPGARLAPASNAAIEQASRTARIRVIESRFPKRRLENARRAIEAAARQQTFSAERGGISIGTDWVEGKIRLSGDLETIEAIVVNSGVDRVLVVVEHGAIRRVVGR